ncbi:MAG: sulfatase [Planctomycetes bacterium]|nr:sulfatase [Planctomycetota bacterium]
MSIAALLLTAVAWVADDGPAAAPAAAPPRRLRLFDHFAPGSALPVPRPAPLPETAARPLGFEPGFAAPVWLARRIGRETRYEADPWSAAALLPEGGAHGGALRLGPGLAEDGSHFGFLLEAKPQTRYVLRGRVRHVGHPDPDAASAREVARLLVHAGRVTDPSRWPRGAPTLLDTQRATRERSEDGWDRFELAVAATDARTGTLEVRLLQRSGGSANAETWFDDLELVEQPLDEAQLLAIGCLGLAPGDREAARTPWRLRVTLPDDGGVKETTKDAALLLPGRALEFDLTVPELAAAPRLRFSHALLPGCFAAPGDGVRLDVTFRSADGSASASLGSFEFDPKNDPEQRRWLHAQVDLLAVAGQTGRLAIACRDVGPPDGQDHVVIATPRIEPREEPPAGWNVLVIASDTLRADRLSAFGYGRPTSPHVERLARGGVTFLQARSQAPWTLPSFSSILTSQYPSQHGAGRGGHDEWTPLEPGVATLADALARVGYETVGITANHLISPEYGLDQGFESYAVPGEVAWQRLGLESVELDAPLVVQFLEQHRATPFFLFWHLMDPHLPYTTDAELRSAFTAADYDGRFRGARREVPFQVLDPRPGRRWFTHEGPPKPPPLSPADVQFVSDYYDAEVAEIDRAIGQVIDALQRLGLWERTVIALVADHGEGLGDHGHYHHGYTLFDDQVHIPLLVRVPGRDEGVQRHDPVQSIDLAPTLLAALDLPAPATFVGRNLLGGGEKTAVRTAPSERDAGTDPAADPAAAPPVFLEYPSYDSSAQKGVVLGRFKYLHDPWFRTEALYDLAADPRELHDVKGDHPDIVARGREQLDAFRWEHLQRGRFHLRVAARAGARLRIALSTDDLFDANFAARPLPPETDCTLDLERRHLVIETTLTADRFELVCWARGDRLTLDVTLDGQPLERGVRLGSASDAQPAPLAFERPTLVAVEGATLTPPHLGEALFWLEPGAGNAAPVVPSPAELELLRQLGYAH